MIKKHYAEKRFWLVLIIPKRPGKWSPGGETTSLVFNILCHFQTLRYFVEIFAYGIYKPCQISDLQLFLLSKTLYLHWCNKRRAGIVHFIGSTPVQKNPSVFHLHFQQCKFYFLHVLKVLNVVLDQSSHSFAWMPSGEEHWYHFQPLIRLAKMHPKYAETMCFSSANLVPKFDTSWNVLHDKAQS